MRFPGVGSHWGAAGEPLGSQSQNHWGATGEPPGSHRGATGEPEPEPLGSHRGTIMLVCFHEQGIGMHCARQAQCRAQNTKAQRMCPASASLRDALAPTLNHVLTTIPKLLRQTKQALILRNCKSDAERGQILPCLGPDLGGSYRILQGSSL